MVKCFFAVDLGATSGRTILGYFTPQGLITEEINRFPNHLIETGGHFYWDIYELYRNIVEGLKIAGNKKDTEIISIGIDTWGVDFVCIGKDGGILRQPYAYRDPQTEGAPEKYFKRVPRNEVYELTGIQVMNFNSLFQLDTLRRNNDSALAHADKILFMPDALSYMLTGEMVTEYTIASTAQLVNAHTRKLDSQILKSIGLNEKHFGRFVYPGEIIGTITNKAAKETGLPVGCPVVAGAGDKQCEILGSGTLNKGQAYITMGTMTGLNLVDDQYIADEYKVTKHRTYTAAVPGFWNAEAVSPRGFWLISWFRDNFAKNLNKDNPKKTIEQLLDEEAIHISPGAEGLITIPDWKSTWDKPYAKGIFMGFDMRHGRAHMFRSLLEGIMMQLKIGTDDMCHSTNREIKELRVGGGGSKSYVAVQAIADIFNLSVKKSEEPETWSLGAAICAAVGAGCFPDFYAAAKAMGQNHTEFLPSTENHKLYQELMEEIVNPYYKINEQLLKKLQQIIS